MPSGMAKTTSPALTGREFRNKRKGGPVSYTHLDVYKRQGFGFIKPDNGGDDLFAHFSAIQARGFKTLRENQKVSFDVTTGPKGKQATNIRPLDEA